MAETNTITDQLTSEQYNAAFEICITQTKSEAESMLKDIGYDNERISKMISHFEWRVRDMQRRQFNVFGRLNELYTTDLGCNSIIAAVQRIQKINGGLTTPPPIPVRCTDWFAAACLILPEGITTNGFFNFSTQWMVYIPNWYPMCHIVEIVVKFLLDYFDGNVDQGLACELDEIFGERWIGPKSLGSLGTEGEKVLLDYKYTRNISMGKYCTIELSQSVKKALIPVYETLLAYYSTHCISPDSHDEWPKWKYPNGFWKITQPLQVSTAANFSDGQMSTLTSQPVKITSIPSNDGVSQWKTLSITSSHLIPSNANMTNIIRLRKMLHETRTSEKTMWFSDAYNTLYPGCPMETNVETQLVSLMRVLTVIGYSWTLGEMGLTIHPIGQLPVLQNESISSCRFPPIKRKDPPPKKGPPAKKR